MTYREKILVETPRFQTVFDFDFVVDFIISYVLYSAVVLLCTCGGEVQRVLPLLYGARDFSQETAVQTR